MGLGWGGWGKVQIKGGGVVGMGCGGGWGGGVYWLLEVPEGLLVSLLITQASQLKSQGNINSVFSCMAMYFNLFITPFKLNNIFCLMMAFPYKKNVLSEMDPIPRPYCCLAW